LVVQQETTLFFVILSDICDWQVKEELLQAGYLVEADTDAGDTMNKKIRNAQLAQYNFIFGKFEFYRLLPNLHYAAHLLKGPGLLFYSTYKQLVLKNSLCISNI